MRVLLVARAGIGGAARHVTDTVGGLSSRHSVLALASPLEDSGYLDALAATGATVRTLPLARGPDPARDLRAIAIIRTEIERFRPDVVHAHTAKPGALARAAAGRTPVVYSPHGYFHDYPTASAWARASARAIERRLASRTAVLAVCSEHEKQVASREGLAGRRGTIVVPNGVTPPPELPGPERQAIRRDLEVPEGGVLVLMAGRLARPKEPQVFLAAAAELPEARFILAGDGPDFDDCRQAAPGNALVLGSRDDVPRLLAAADVAVLATRYEAGPYFVLEAMAAGVPAVVTDLPTTREMVGDAGSLVPSGDPAALAEALSSFCDSAPRRLELGEQGRRRAASVYSVERMLEEVERAWATAVA